MGEGFNVGWTATIAGHELGEPQQIAGGFNGWWLPPSTTATVVNIEWQAQSPVTVALILSVFGVLGCVILAIGRRRTVSTAAAAATQSWGAEPPSFNRSVLAPVALRPAALSAVVLVGLTALVVSPSMALVALVPAVAMIVFRRPAIAGAAALLLVASIGARITKGQVLGRYAANAGWPGLWSNLHGQGLLVVTLLVAATLLDRPEQPVPPGVRSAG
jgi:hypothetical protein